MEHKLCFRTRFLAQSLAVFCNADLTVILNVIPKFTAPLFLLWYFIAVTDRQTHGDIFFCKIYCSLFKRPTYITFLSGEILPLQKKKTQNIKHTPKISNKHKINKPATWCSLYVIYRTSKINTHQYIFYVQVTVLHRNKLLYNKTN